MLIGCSGGSRNESYTVDYAMPRPESAAAPNMISGGGMAREERDDMYNVYFTSEAEIAYSYYDSPSADMPAMTTGGMGQEAKILQTGWVNMHSDRFDEVTDTLRNLAPEAGGFVESAALQDYFTHHSGYRQQRTRDFSITLRVPRERFGEVMRRVESLGVVRSSNQSAEDVTARYYDIAGRLATKRIEEERVLEMIDRAVDINDLLNLENRLGQIRTDIELFQSQMLAIDRLATFSTIHVNLTEVTTEALIINPEGLGQRIGLAFTRSVNGTVVFMQNFIIWLAGALIPLLITGLLLFFGVKIALTVARRV
jgi:hypothetical protein